MKAVTGRERTTGRKSVFRAAKVLSCRQQELLRECDISRFFLRGREQRREDRSFASRKRSLADFEDFSGNTNVNPFFPAREKTTGRKPVFCAAKAGPCRSRGFLRKWDTSHSFQRGKAQRGEDRSFVQRKCCLTDSKSFSGNAIFRIPVTGTSQSPVKIRKTVVPKGKTLANTPILRYYGKVTDTGGKSPRNLPAKRRKQEESRT